MKGRPSSGKTRLLVEALSRVKDASVLVSGEGLQDVGEWQGKLFLLLDDLESYIDSEDFDSTLIEMRKKCRQLIVVATLRTGDEFDRVEQKRTEWLYMFDRTVELSDLRDEDALKLAEKLERSTRDFDGTPGSIVIDLIPVRARYNKLGNPMRAIMRSLKLLYLLNIRHPSTVLLGGIATHFFGIDGDRMQVRQAAKTLVSNSLLQRKKGGYSFFHDVYAEKVVIDYTHDDIAEDLDEAVNIVIELGNILDLVKLSGWFYLNNNFMKAKEIGDIALSKDPENPMAYLNRGAARRRLGDLTWALEDYNKALEIDPFYSNALNNRGLIKRALGMEDEAILDYERAMDLSPKSPHPYNNRGIIRRRLGDVEGAIADFTRAIELDPDLFDAYNNLANVYCFNIHDYVKAEEFYDKALEKKPDFAFALSNRGQAKFYQGKYEQAQLDHLRAVRLLPDNGFVHYSFALCLLYLNKVDQSMEEFQRAVEIMPHLSEEINADELILEYIKTHPQNKKKVVAALKRLLF